MAGEVTFPIKAKRGFYIIVLILTKELGGYLENDVLYIPIHGRGFLTENLITK